MQGLYVSHTKDRETTRFPLIEKKNKNRPSSCFMTTVQTLRKIDCTDVILRVVWPLNGPVHVVQWI